MGIMSRRTYLMIGLGFAVFLFLLAQFFGTDIAAFADSLPGQVSPNVQSIAQFIVEPIKFVMLNPILGPLLAGLLWPVVLLWLLLLFLLVVLTAAGQVQTDIDTNTPL